MIAAGFADLMSRPASQADCLLAHLVAGAPAATDADDLIAASWHLAGSVSEIWQRGKPIYFRDLDKEANEHGRQRLTQLHGPSAPSWRYPSLTGC